MKLNIFARLNKLEEALENKTLELERLNKTFDELRKIVLFQGSIFDQLNKQVKPIDNKVESPEERVKRSKREWYQKNKEEILKRRKIKNNNDDYEKRKVYYKNYYWKNREKVLSNGRKYYLKKKSEAALKKLQET